MLGLVEVQFGCGNYTFSHYISWIYNIHVHGSSHTIFLASVHMFLTSMHIFWGFVHIYLAPMDMHLAPMHMFFGSVQIFSTLGSHGHRTRHVHKCFHSIHINLAHCIRSILIYEKWLCASVSVQCVRRASCWKLTSERGGCERNTTLKFHEI